MAGHWIGLGIVSLMALAALRPPRRPSWLRQPGYLVGWMINEMPLVWALLVVLASWLTLHERHWRIQDPQLAVALAAGAMLIGLLIFLQLRARGARDAFDDALKESLRIRLPHRDRRALRWLNLSSVVLPFRRRGSGVTHLRNVRYGEHGYRNLLDVYTPRDRTPVGVFVHFHGGHFRIGRKDTQSLPLLYELAREGWVCVSANYRLQPRAQFPDFVVDAKRAIAWARNHALEQGIDPDMIVAAGDSAGGYLALFAGATPNDPRYQPGFEDEDTRVRAVVGLYGYYGRTSEDPTSSPLDHLTAELPPTLLVHGELDSSVPVEWAREAVAELRSVATEPVVYAEIPGAQHTFDYFRSPRCEALIEATSRFLWWLRGGPEPNDEELRGRPDSTPADS